MSDDERFRDRDLVFAGADGSPIEGTSLEIPSANPVNYHQAITDPSRCEPITVDGKLFAPAGADLLPAIIVVPGSLGVGPNHLAHAETLVAAGYVVVVIDPFGPRSVSSTVANQTQYSFAASAWDVVAAARVAAEQPSIDRGRIAAQGHSRGGAAVLTAAMRPFVDAVGGEDLSLAAVYSVYPWCGHQFRRPDVGATVVRAIIGDQDDWLSVQQVQSQIHAMQLTGADASLRIVGGAAHSFDRLEPLHELPEASVAPTAPTAYIDDDGSLIDPLTAVADPALTDRDLFLAAVKSGFGRRGAHIGGVGDQPGLFVDDMLGFYRQTLGVPAPATVGTTGA